MSSKRKHNSIKELKARYGLMFISPWIIGMILFFIYPIFHSIWLSFSNLSLGADGIITEFVKGSNYYKILVTDPKYLNNVLDTIKGMLISVPFILVVSMVLALLLNGEYKGRIFFRGLYFMPVIIATGVVLQLFLKAASTNATEAAVSDAAGFDMIDFNAVLSGLNLPESIETYLSSVLSDIFMLVWQSGIQTVLIIAGLQSIPELHYEVARVEGANSWETFWFVTFPQLIRTMILVIIFTIIEYCSLNTNTIISTAYAKFNDLEYGVGSAMLGFYYMFVAVIMLVIFFLYNKFFAKKWGESA